MKKIALVLAILMVVTVFGTYNSSATVPSVTTETPITHVVEIMMENHAFDNIFGKYPCDFNTSSNQTLINSLEKPVNLITSPPDPYIMNQLKAIPNGTYSTADPVEGYSAYHLDWNNGKMNGFYNNSGPQSMTYYTASQVAPLWNLAEEYSLGDMYFASMLSETSPNRLYNMAGFSPVINDYGPPPYIPFSETIFGELQSHGISWGYYTKAVNSDMNVLGYISGITEKTPELGSWQEFLSELKNNSIPSVSYVMPIGGHAVDYSSGPPHSMLKGELWLIYMIDAIMQSPEWNSTAIFLTFDEGGGFYDQVAPPYVGGHMLGQRIPFILISPYSKENYVSSTVLNHASILGFIDYNWKLPALNRFVSLSNIPLDMFNFNTPYQSGNIRRTPMPVLTNKEFQLPSSPVFSLERNPPSLSSIFPLPLQIPIHKLPYSRSGNSIFNLSQVSSSLYIESDQSYVPWYVTDQFLIASSALSIFIAAIAGIRMRRRIK